MAGALLDRMPRVAGPFDPDDASGYREWRARKLAGYPRDVAALTVEIRDPRALTLAERAALVDRCRRANMAVYVCGCTTPTRTCRARWGASSA